MPRLKFIRCRKPAGSGAHWKDLTVLSVLAFLSFLCFKNVFLDGGILAFEDLSPMYKFEQLYRPLDFPWDDKSNVGTPNFYLGNAFYNIGLMAFSIPCGSVVLGHKLLFTFLLILSGYSFYLFSKHLIGSRVCALLSSLYYMYNPWIFHHVSLAHNTIFLGYAVFPVALLSYFKSFTDRRFKNLLASGLASSILFLASFHLSYLFLMTILLHALIQALADIKDKSKLASSLTPALGTFALTISFTFPILYHFYKVEIPAFTIWKETLALYMPPPSPMDIAHLILGSSIALASIPLVEDARLKAFLLSLCAMGASLSLLGLNPLKPLFELLVKIIPGFFIFRATNKFLLLSVVAVASLLGLLSAGALNKARNKAALTALLTLLVLSPSWRLLSGDYGGALRTVEVPEYYRELDDWLRSQEGDFRIAYLPPAVWATEYEWADHWFLDPAVALQAKPTVEIKGESDTTLSSSFVRWIYTTIYMNRTGHIGKLLGLLGVKYVIVRMDADMPPFRGDLKLFTLPNTLRILQSRNDLKFLRSFGPLLVYENPNPLPHIFGSEEISLVAGDRGVLASLSDIESFNFETHPIAFLDNNAALKDLLPYTDLLIMDGDRRWDLLLNWLGQAVTIEPWGFAEASADIGGGWIKGDYAWWFKDGEMNLAPDNYIATVGGNRISIPFHVDQPDYYMLLAQVLKSPDKDLIGVKFKVDEGGEVFINTTSMNGESRFEWSEVGEYRLNGGQHKLELTSVGAAAVSKIALAPSRLVSDAEKEMLKVIQNSKVTPIHVFKGHMDRFYALKSGLYALHIEGGAKAFIDGALIDGSAEAHSNHLPALVKLDQGLHTIELEGTGNRTESLALLYQVDGGDMGFPWLSGGPPNRLEYMKHSGSKYKVNVNSRFILFLEAYSSYWRLNGLPPSIILGYATSFKVDEDLNGAMATIVYLGSTYVKEGMAFSIVSAVLVCSYLLYDMKWRKSSLNRFK